MNKDPLIGRVLHDTHEVVRLIGQGGMGSVYEAVHKRLRKQKFAIKVLHQRMVEDDTIFARFQREAEIATEVGHPSIISVVDFYETEEGLPCMVMEFLEGEDLGQRLKRQGKLTPHEVMELVEQVGGALQAVHDKGVVHRDLKPANIFMVDRADGKMKVKVLDFGISKIRDSGTLTGEKAVLGTPHYMSPEQGEGGTRDVDHRTDIFALGTICYQVLSGKVPFDAPTMLGVIRAICDKPHEPVTVHAPNLGPEVDHVLNRALAKKKEDRYQRVEEFTRELTRAIVGEEEPVREEDRGAPPLLGRATRPHLLMVDDQLPTAGPPDAKITDVLDIEAALHGRVTVSDHDVVSPEIPAKVDAPKKPLEEARLFGGSPNPNITNVMGIDEVFSGDSVVPEEPVLLKTPERKVEVSWDKVMDLDPGAHPEAGHRVPDITTLSGSAGERPTAPVLSMAQPAVTPLKKGRMLAGVGAAAAALLVVVLFFALRNPAPSRDPVQGDGSPAASSATRTETRPPQQQGTTAAPGAVKDPSPGAPGRPVAPVTAPLGAAKKRPRPARKEKPPLAKKVRIALRLTPSTAKVFLDGEPRLENPLVLMRTGKVHQLKIEAEGYESAEQRFEATSSFAIVITLKAVSRGKSKTEAGRARRRGKSRRRRAKPGSGEEDEGFSNLVTPRPKSKPPKKIPKSNWVDPFAK